MNLLVRYFAEGDVVENYHVLWIDHQYLAGALMRSSFEGVIYRQSIPGLKEELSHGFAYLGRQGNTLAQRFWISLWWVSWTD